MVEKRRHALGDDDLPALRTDGRIKPDHRRELRVCMSCRQHHFASTDRALLRAQAELALLPGDVLDTMQRPKINTRGSHRFMQRPKKAQRIHMPVKRAISCACDIGTDMRQHARERRMVEHLKLILWHAGLGEHSAVLGGQSPQFVVRHGRHEPAAPIEPDVDACRIAQQRRELAPIVRRLLAPCRILWIAEAFALDPHQGKVAARRPRRVIALVEHDNLLSQQRKTEGDGGANHPGADHRDVEISTHLHVCPEGAFAFTD